MKKNVLITGFEPFDEYKINSSWETAKNLTSLPDYVHRIELPVDHIKARYMLVGFLNELQPSICLCMGLCPGNLFRIEQLARKPDLFVNLISEDTLSGIWPWKEMSNVFKKSHIGFIFSNDAGNYVCESTYWTLLEYKQIYGFPKNAAFLHIPPLSDTLSITETTSVVHKIISIRIKGLFNNM
jgi:pyroglutamyl-peptidase